MVDKNDKKGVNSAAVAIAGAAVGVAAAVFANKDNRRKLIKKANQLKKAGKRELEIAQRKVNKAKEKSKKKLADKLTEKGK